MDGYYPPFRAERTGNGGGVITYVGDDIPCILLKAHPSPTNFEGILLEINLNKSKWLLFGGYNPKLENTGNFVKASGLVLDFYMSKYDNFLLLGDFNSEMNDNAMREFSDTYNLKNWITNPTCFKNPSKPGLIDLILTNRHRNFLNSKVIETGLSDHHKLTITVMSAHFKTPLVISYRDYTNYGHSLFCYELIGNLNNLNGGQIDCETFESVTVATLNRHAPLKKKYMRANNQPFMKKTLSKAVMNRSRLRNKCLMNPNNINKLNYTKYRNYCTQLFKKEKKSTIAILISI